MYYRFPIKENTAILNIAGATYKNKQVLQK